MVESVIARRVHAGVHARVHTHTRLGREVIGDPPDDEPRRPCPRERWVDCVLS